MTKEQIRNGIDTLNDAATASMIANSIIKTKDEEAVFLLFKKLLQLFEGGHPQTKELAIVGRMVLDAGKI